MHYFRVRRTGSVDLTDRSARPCVAPGCLQTARTKAGLCGRHHERFRKHGDIHTVMRRPRKVVARSGYVMVFAPSHILARRDGYVARNRLMLYGSIGGDEHPCHWCGRSVRWFARWGIDGDCLVADHLNSVRHEDSPWNLVPSCIACNVKRGKH